MLFACESRVGMVFGEPRFGSCNIGSNSGPGAA